MTQRVRRNIPNIQPLSDHAAGIHKLVAFLHPSLDVWTVLALLSLASFAAKGEARQRDTECGDPHTLNGSARGHLQVRGIRPFVNSETVTANAPRVGATT